MDQHLHDCEACKVHAAAEGGFWSNIVNSDFMPRAECIGNRPDVLWLHVVSDGAIALAYYSIPLALVSLVRRRKDLVFGWMFLMFASFILACGTTHLFDIAAFWHPMYRLDGVVKAATGAISMVTAVMLWVLIPKALTIPSPAQLRSLNESLTREVEIRRRAEDELEAANAALEARVAERTQALAERAAELELVNDTAAVGLCLVDADGRVVRFNRTFAGLRGMVGEPTIGAALASVSPVLARVLEETPAGEPVRARAVVADAGSGEPAHWLVSVQSFDLSGGRAGRSVAVLDATERLALEAKLRQSQKMEAVGQIASGIAHDVNNALTAIYGHVNLARSNLDRPSAVGDSLQKVQLAAEQAARITKSLLTFAKPEPPSLRPIEVEQVVSRAMTLVRGIMPANIRVSVDMSGAEGAWVSADVTQMQQVLVNLALNARDAMPQGGSLSIRATADDQTVRLEVSDTGIGIAESDLPRIFDPFFTTKARGQGTGLGLSMVVGIMRAHAGSVRVSSAVGVGTTFTLELPRARAGEPGAEPVSPPPAPPRDERVMIVLADDNAQVREALTVQLSSAGYLVRAAEDGEGMIRLCRSLTDRPRVYVLDVDMPRISGIEVLRELRRAGDTTPAVLVTGGRVTGIEADPWTKVLYKPFSQEELLTAISRALRGAA